MKRTTTNIHKLNACESFSFIIKKLA